MAKTQFEYFAKRHGPPIKCQRADDDAETRYRGVLPDMLLEDWKTVGWCGWGKGLIWIIDPRPLEDLLRRWCPDEKDAIPIVRTAFADLIYWTPKGVRRLNVQYREVFELTTEPSQFDLLFEYYLISDDIMVNVLDQPMFEKALARLGPLEPDECYGFVPVPALGGSGEPETLQKVKLREYLAILEQVVAP